MSATSTASAEPYITELQRDDSDEVENLILDVIQTTVLSVDSDLDSDVICQSAQQQIQDIYRVEYLKESNLSFKSAPDHGASLFLNTVSLLIFDIATRIPHRNIKHKVLAALMLQLKSAAIEEFKQEACTSPVPLLAVSYRYFMKSWTNTILRIRRSCIAMMALRRRHLKH